jgi:hypothetical protein
VRKFLLILLLASPAYGANLTTFWANDGSEKIARQDIYPDGDVSKTLTTNWDGDTASTFGGRNETVSLVLYMKAGASAATEVTVVVSSLTGPSGDGIVSVEVSSMNVYNWENRPIEVFYARYLQIEGMSQLMMEPSEYDAYHYPPRFRRPCTVNVNGACAPDGGTLFTDRPDHNKFYPEILVPWEAVRHSSFTVAASSSQAIWIDYYIAKNKTPGVYRGSITVKEGVTVSTTIPVELTVKGFTLPDAPNFKSVINVGRSDIAWRHYGTRDADDTANQLATRNRYHQFLKRHKMSSMGGESVAQDYPTAEFTAKLNGSLYSNASGYYNAPGVDTPDPYFSIGTYGAWQSGAGWSTTNAATFCTKVNAWANWFAANSPTTVSWLYLTDEPADLTDTNKWSTWMSTSCAQNASYRVKSMVTASHVGVNSGATYLQFPFSTTYMSASSTTINTTVSSYTTHQDAAWYYNTYTPFTGLSMTEAGGYEPREVPIGFYKKNVMNWFFWESTYWTGSNNGYCRTPDDNDIWNDAQTFGCSSALAYNTVKGMTDYQFANGDGVLMYPGKDTYDTANSYGLNGPFASWRLKMFRRGIQDVDYFVMANEANPTATTTALNVLVGGKVAWEYNCFSLGDCSYGYGPRGFSEDASDYEAQRLVLADLIPSGATGSTSTSLTGSIIFGGGVTIR